MPSRLARASFFLSAYAPLLILLAVLRSFKSDISSYVCGGLAGLGLVVTFLYWRSAQRQQWEWFQIERTRPRDGDVLNFFVTYVVPFAAAPLDSTRARWALVLFVVFVAALYLRARLYQVHPILLLFGYHLFEVDLKEGVTVGLLTKNPFLPQTTSLKAIPLMPNVFLEAK